MKKNRRVRINTQKVAKNVVFLFVFLVLVTLITSSVSAKKEFITKDITIAKADTLWSIADNITSENTNLNIQNVIYDIQEANNMQNSDIYAGQVLKIPVY